MTWLEMINVRTARVIEAERVIEVCRQSFQSLAVEKLSALTVYCSAKYPTDISIHFEWESDPRPGSILGSVVSSALKEFGLVSHTLWIKQKEFGIHHKLEMGLSQIART